jgi:hypothetical protein
VECHDYSKEKKGEKACCDFEIPYSSSFLKSTEGEDRYIRDEDELGNFDNMVMNDGDQVVGDDGDTKIIH